MQLVRRVGADRCLIALFKLGGTTPEHGNLSYRRKCANPVTSMVTSMAMEWVQRGVNSREAFLKHAKLLRARPRISLPTMNLIVSAQEKKDSSAFIDDQNTSSLPDSVSM